MFNETVRNVNDQKPPTILEEDESFKKRRPQNLTGFTILDEKWKDSSSGDSDDSLPAGSYISSSQTAGRFCKSVDFRPLQREHSYKGETTPCTLPNTPTHKNPPSAPQAHSMATGGSRFKIVPVEARYRRNRWNCYDFYDRRDPFFTRGAKVSLPSQAAIALKKEDIVNRSSRSLSDIHPIPVSVPQKTVQHPPVPLPKPVYIAPKNLPKSPNVHSHTITNGSAAQASLKNGSAETLKGLESSLTNNTEPRRTKSVAASPPIHHSANIDSKIEQAMDLVKTHLMFAVREEVDGLRSKIFDLENHVHRLESENAILKRTIPGDVLKKLNFKL